ILAMRRAIPVHSSKCASCWELARSALSEASPWRPQIRAHAVNHEVIRIRALTVYAELALLIESRGRNQHNAGCQIEKRTEAATVERQVFHESVFNHSTHGRHFGAQQRRSRNHLDCFGH